ncbi:hypothetical protein [Phocaeicola dorei]|uniref:hypothetical protein n=1 Tax=Phocaeicola dorei TaxID=357276 RepID=UPI0021A2D223|nr:hypothetical protein [Phocaeicola dorei]
MSELLSSPLPSGSGAARGSPGNPSDRWGSSPRPLPRAWTCVPDVSSVPPVASGVSPSLSGWAAASLG